MCACVHASILSSSTNILYVSIHKYTHTHTYMLNIDTHSRPLVPPQAPIPSPHIPASYYTVAPTDQYFLSVPPPPANPSHPSPLLHSITNGYILSKRRHRQILPSHTL